MLLQMERAKPREFTMGRQRSIPSFEDQIAADKLRLEAEVAHLPSGRRKDQLLRKIRQLETASHISDWLSSPGLQPPKDSRSKREDNKHH